MNENNEEKTNDKKMSKKKIVIPLMIMLGIGLVIAGVYYVNTINLTVDVLEPFTVQYAILGDAGNYEGTPLCTDTSIMYSSLTNNGVFDKDGFFPMESRKVCVKIINAGEASIPYVITSTTTGGTECRNAFANKQLIGIAKPGNTIDGALVTIASDAKDIEDCNIKIEVGRGVIDGSATMHFTQKDTTTWIPKENGITADIIYSTGGTSFDVSGIPSGYTLVYYPDIGTFTENVAGIIVLSEGTNSIGNLPISVDVGDSYCTNGFNPNAKVCNGAKLWLIPGTLDSASAKTFLTNWNTNAPSILFETDLITYTKTA